MSVQEEPISRLSQELKAATLVIAVFALVLGPLLKLASLI